MNTSDPVMEQVIISLTDRSSKFNNPFQLAEHIEQMLRTQAEQAGTRALSWNISDFDKIGGQNTLRTVWNSLKEEHRVCGLKRNADTDREDCTEED